MTPEELKTVFSNLKIWKRDGERAPHKPLLLLMALAEFQRNNSRLLSYSAIREKLKQLLIEFGPRRHSYHPSYPFVRLQNDGIWEITGRDPLDSRRDYSDRELENNGACGGFTKEVHTLLKGSPELIRELAMILLTQSFPETIHEDILAAVGLDLEIETTRISCDPFFREKVLRAYNYCCAICGFHVRLGDRLVAVEAAHIKWHQAGGPHTVQNGIALCTMHHKLFDRGVFTLTKSMKLLVAENAYGTGGFEEWVLKYHGKEIRSPQNLLYKPKDRYLDWHVREVFKGPARYATNLE